jgi:hypothetical protein
VNEPRETVSQELAASPVPTVRLAPLVRTLVIDILIPYGILQLLLRRGAPPSWALAAASLVPLGDALVSFVRTRRLPVVAMMTAIVLVVSSALSLVSADPRFALAQGSAVTAILGITFLASLAMRRPLVQTLLAQYASDGAAGHEDVLEARWRTHGPYRARMRAITAIWGLGLFGEAVARAAVVATLPPARAASVAPTIDALAVSVLVAFSIAYARWAERRGRAELEAARMGGRGDGGRSEATHRPTP